MMAPDLEQALSAGNRQEHGFFAGENLEIFMNGGTNYPTQWPNQTLLPMTTVIHPKDIIKVVPYNSSLTAICRLRIKLYANELLCFGQP